MADSGCDIPNGWEPRFHQKPLWRYMQAGGLRGVAVWHRRAGKDSVALNWTAVAAHKRKGNYWHLLPEYAQARKAIWDAIDPHTGVRFIDQVFPPEIRDRTVDDEMKIVLRCGSTWQVGGSDRYNALVGSNPCGITLSEYSISNPTAWDFLRPILLENGGWAMFLYTPRGRNHGKTLFDIADKLQRRDREAGLTVPSWHAELLTVVDTGLITPAQIQKERDDGMDDDMIEQEYFCSWQGVRQGSIYGAAMAKARADGRIGAIPYDRRFAVNTFWDIGHSDATSLWFHQDTGGGRHHFIKAYEAAGEDLSHYVKFMQETGYLFGVHHLPHDARNVTLSSKSNPLGKNIWDQAISLGIQAKDLVLVPRTPDRWTAINATRLRMDTVYFDEEGCKDGISALESYHKKWDDERKCFSSDPHHDWSSNFADAFRQWSQGYQARAGAGVFTFPSFTSGAPGSPGVATLNRPPRINTVGHRKTGY